MKEVFINARFLTQQISGVQKFAIELCQELKVIYPNLQFIAPNNILHTNLAEELEVITFGNREGQLWEQLDLPRFLKNKDSPLLISLCNSAPLFYHNNIVTIHDLAFIENPKWFSFSFRTWYNFLIPRIVKKAKHILTVSEFSKKELQNKLHISEKKITVIYNGLSKELLNFNTEPRDRKKIILTVGSINPRKNLSALITGFSSLNLDNYELLIVGAKHTNFNTEKLSFDSSKIKFSGYVSDKELWNLYKEATLFVFPSLYEGFGIPALEAIYFECPTILADLEVYKEVYNNFELTYASGNDSHAYAKVIGKTLNKELKTRPITIDILNKCSYKTSALKVAELLKTKNL